MRKRIHAALFALLVCAGVAVSVLDVQKVAGRQAPAAGAGSGIEQATPAAPIPLTCQDECTNQYNACILLAAGDADLGAQCEQQRIACLATCPTGAPTTTLIGLDKPDPSQPGQNVTVHVAIVGADHPTGTVTITGADVNCTCTLNPAANGHCTVVFNAPGTYTLTATYSGDATHNGSSDTETHTVQ